MAGRRTISNNRSSPIYLHGGRVRVIATLLFSGRCRLSRDEIDFQVVRPVLDISFLANTRGKSKYYILFNRWDKIEEWGKRWNIINRGGEQ